MSESRKDRKAPRERRGSIEELNRPGTSRDEPIRRRSSRDETDTEKKPDRQRRTSKDTSELKRTSSDEIELRRISRNELDIQRTSRDKIKIRRGKSREANLHRRSKCHGCKLAAAFRFCFTCIPTKSDSGSELKLIHKSSQKSLDDGRSDGRGRTKPNKEHVHFKLPPKNKSLHRDVFSRMSLRSSQTGERFSATEVRRIVKAMITTEPRFNYTKRTLKLAAQQILSQGGSFRIIKEEFVERSMLEKRNEDVKYLMEQKRNLDTDAFRVSFDNCPKSVTVIVENIEMHARTSKLMQYSELINKIGYRSRYDLTSQFVNIEAFCFIKDWMNGKYTTEDLNENNIVQIYTAAKFLVIRDLGQEIIAILSDTNSFLNEKAVTVYENAVAYDLLVIQELIIPKIKSCFLGFVGSKLFVRLRPIDVCLFLSSDFLEPSDEIEIFFAAIRWLSYKWKLRFNNITQLMSCIRFEWIDHEQLFSIAETDEIINEIINCPDVQSMIHDGLGYYMYYYLDKKSKKKFKKYQRIWRQFLPRVRKYNHEDTTYLHYQDFVNLIKHHNAKDNEGKAKKTSKKHHSSAKPVCQCKARHEVCKCSSDKGKRSTNITPPDSLELPSTSTGKKKILKAVQHTTQEPSTSTDKDRKSSSKRSASGSKSTRSDHATEQEATISPQTVVDHQQEQANIYKASVAQHFAEFQAKEDERLMKEFTDLTLHQRRPMPRRKITEEDRKNLTESNKETEIKDAETQIDTKLSLLELDTVREVRYLSSGDPDTPFQRPSTTLEQKYKTGEAIKDTNEIDSCETEDTDGYETEETEDEEYSDNDSDNKIKLATSSRIQSTLEIRAMKNRAIDNRYLMMRRRFH